jgi:hypothetical protein
MRPALPFPIPHPKKKLLQQELILKGFSEQRGQYKFSAFAFQQKIAPKFYIDRFVITSIGIIARKEF